MFRNKKTDAAAQNQYLNYIAAVVLPEFQQGKRRELNSLYTVFALEGCEHYQIEAAGICQEILEALSPKQFIRMEEQFRKNTCTEWGITCGQIDWGRLYPSRDRFSHLSLRQYNTVLKLGTFHANGYYRQRCMELVAEQEGSLPFLILRLNDWVEQIREEAFVLAGERLCQCGAEELFQAMPCFGKVQSSRRRKTEYINKLEEQLQSSLAGKIAQVSLRNIRNYDISVRNAIYRFVSCHPVLDREEMELLLALEKDGLGKKTLIMGILQNFDCGEEQIKRYLHSKSAVVRYLALEYQYQRLGNAWDGLEELLLDKSKRVRGTAGCILEQHTDFDVLDFYLKKLNREENIVVILGVGEHGSESEAELIRPFLESASEPTVRAALTAFGRLAGAGEEEIYWNYLMDGRPGIARQAYLVVRKLEISYGAEKLYQAFLARRDSRTGRYLLNLLLREPSWKRLLYLLLLYDIEDMDMRAKIYHGVSVRNMYAKVTAEQAGEIRQILEQMGERIPGKVKSGILFDLKHVSVGWRGAAQGRIPILQTAGAGETEGSGGDGAPGCKGAGCS